ncbi:hypothetical protein I4F81_006967 [Pyropia yezoensis]|uniref:Uncharacterized protein n=1 Tax=Pyropia yezoensis TaxID=2788 RepID=A0ACC3C2S4_PYRYE|nr:hypothetical protein I4F81_006967 [Neopyropia yezoensis]
MMGARRDRERPREWRRGGRKDGARGTVFFWQLATRGASPPQRTGAADGSVRPTPPPPPRCLAPATDGTASAVAVGPCNHCRCRGCGRQRRLPPPSPPLLPWWRPPASDAVVCDGGLGGRVPLAGFKMVTARAFHRWGSPPPAPLPPSLPPSAGYRGGRGSRPPRAVGTAA